MNKKNTYRCGVLLLLSFVFLAPYRAIGQSSDRTVDRIKSDESYRAERMNRPDFCCIESTNSVPPPFVTKDGKLSVFSDPKKFVWVYRRESSEWCILPLTSRDYPSPAPIGEPTK
jgi:hypothetical protein